MKTYRILCGDDAHASPGTLRKCLRDHYKTNKDVIIDFPDLVSIKPDQVLEKLIAKLDHEDAFALVLDINYPKDNRVFAGITVVYDGLVAKYPQMRPWRHLFFQTVYADPEHQHYSEVVDMLIKRGIDPKLQMHLPRLHGGEPFMCKHLVNLIDISMKNMP
ncbi:MAG: hypothetical protein H6813_06760 [Phycisphaeraceae bacterium]|nr:hypothetical protein [Phycisphaeraceae bacterium]